MQTNEFFYGGNEPHWLKNDEHQRRHDYMADVDHPASGRTLPTYEFRVPMCCPKCEEKVREELSEMDGVYEIFADQLSRRVTVTGFVDPFQALKKMKRIKKKSQFWDGRSVALKSSLRDDKSYHKKPHSRHHETVYRAFPSQVSYNREPSRGSSSRFKNKYGSYDDEVSYSGLRADRANRNMFYGPSDDEISYSGLRADRANRNMFYGPYNDEISHSSPLPPSANRNLFFGPYDDEISHSGLRANRNKFYGSYDDEISVSGLRPARANRNKFYGSYDDEISHSGLRPARVPRNKFYGFYDDEISYSDLRPLRNKHCGFYDDETSYCDLRLASSYRPGYRPGYEGVPPFAQPYDTEEPVEEYPFYAHY